MGQIHKCGKCGGEFATDQEYLDHECPETGFKPTDPENLGEEFKAVQEAALKRGAEKKEEVKK